MKYATPLARGLLLVGFFAVTVMAVVHVTGWLPVSDHVWYTLIALSLVLALGIQIKNYYDNTERTKLVLASSIALYAIGTAVYVVISGSGVPVGVPVFGAWLVGLLFVVDWVYGIYDTRAQTVVEQVDSERVKSTCGQLAAQVNNVCVQVSKRSKLSKEKAREIAKKQEESISLLRAGRKYAKK